MPKSFGRTTFKARFAVGLSPAPHNDSFWNRLKGAWLFFRYGLPVVHSKPPADAPVLFDTPEQAIGSKVYQDLLAQDCMRNGAFMLYIVTFPTALELTPYEDTEEC